MYKLVVINDDGKTLLMQKCFSLNIICKHIQLPYNIVKSIYYGNLEHKNYRITICD